MDHYPIAVGGEMGERTGRRTDSIEVCGEVRRRHCPCHECAVLAGDRARTCFESDGMRL